MPLIGGEHERIAGRVEMLLPRLTFNGPPTPVYDDAGTLSFTPTEPIPQVLLVDLPSTVQSLVLCTAVLKTLNRKAAPGEI